MRKFLTLITFAFLFAPVSTMAVEKGGITMPDTLQAGGDSLALNGAGIRSKFVFDLYVAGLYLKNKSSNAAAIIKSSDPMAIRLHIISGKITSEKMSKATREGFEKSTGKNTSGISSEIDQFIGAFSDPIKEGDVFEFVSTADGVNVTKNDSDKATIVSDEFKQALFGIWLSDHPVQSKLKNGMLGK